MAGILEVQGIHRHFGDHHVLQDVSFTVQPGKLTGFVGANGAGKTTTMRIILGVLQADSGQVLWDGLPVDRERRASFGYMPEERGLYPKMKILDQLVFLGRLHGLSKTDARERGQRLLDELGLGDRSGDILQKLSLGNQQRVQVAASLIHAPSALILDEPFSGLDPLAVDVMSAQLSARAAAGVPVLFSSHQLDLVERLCDEIVIIAGGKIVSSGTPAALRGERSRPTYRVSMSGHGVGWAQRLAGDLPQWRLADAKRDDAVFEYSERVLPAGMEQELLIAAQRLGQVQAFVPIQPNLTDIFREVSAPGPQNAPDEEASAQPESEASSV